MAENIFISDFLRLTFDTVIVVRIIHLRFVANTQKTTIPINIWVHTELDCFILMAHWANVSSDAKLI